MIRWPDFRFPPINLYVVWPSAEMQRVNADLKTYERSMKMAEIERCSGCVSLCPECKEGIDLINHKALETRVDSIRDSKVVDKSVSDGSTADYYKLPKGATQLQDLIAFKNMNGQIAECFRALYRYGEVSHSPMERDLKKIKYYIEAELDRLKRYT